MLYAFMQLFLLAFLICQCWSKWEKLYDRLIFIWDFNCVCVARSVVSQLQAWVWCAGARLHWCPRLQIFWPNSSRWTMQWNSIVWTLLLSRSSESMPRVITRQLFFVSSLYFGFQRAQILNYTCSQSRRYLFICGSDNLGFKSYWV